MFMLMHSFWAKYMFLESKKYRGVIFYDTKEGYKIWRGINFSFQNLHEEFDKFWPEHSKISKIFTLMGSFWAEYISFEIFHDFEEWCKMWRKIKLWFQKWYEKWQFSPEHSKVSKLGLDRILLSEVENLWG